MNAVSTEPRQDGRPGRRVREQVRDGLAVMVLSVVASCAVAGLAFALAAFVG